MCTTTHARANSVESPHGGVYTSQWALSRSRSRDVEVEVEVVGPVFAKVEWLQGSLLYFSREESLGNHFLEVYAHEFITHPILTCPSKC